MRNLMQDSARWGATGLLLGIALGAVLAASPVLGSESFLMFAALFGIIGLCLGPLSLIVYRAGQMAGPRRLAYGALWGGAWGLALGSLYWFFYDSTFPPWHVALPTAILAACGLINTALNITTDATFRRSHPISHHSRPIAR